MKQDKSLTKLYTTAEVAQALNLSVSQIKLYASSGRLKHHKIGHKTIRFTFRQYEDFLKRVLV